MLLARNITPEILQKEERYWEEVITEDFGSDTNYACAVAAHAEEMRLERITDRKLDFVDHEPDVVLQREWGMKT